LILALNITEENPLLNLFQQIDHILEGYQEESKPRRGRPRLFQDVHILKCLVYQAFYRIVSFWELEWRLVHDPVAQALIGLKKVPDYTTLFLRASELEGTFYHEMYQVILHLLEPDCRVSMWDSTALRASRYDSEARKGKGTRLGWYIGYKLHATVSSDRIPLAWDVTTANVYDNQCSHLLESVQLDIFILLADGACDDSALFQKAEENHIHLVTEVNRRRAMSLDRIKDSHRRQNIHYMTEGLGRRMMRQRSEIERFISVLKVQYHLENPRLFGLKSYYRHVMWVIFAYLCDRQVDKSIGIQTAKAPWNR
jgi:hypothetical protein